jgi:hypothetical protein
MADDEYVSQYNTEEYEPSTPSVEQSNISVKKLPMTTEIRIGAHDISVINPAYVEALQRKLLAMENRFKLLDDEIRMMKQKTSKQTDLIARLGSELDKKIDRG